MECHNKEVWCKGGNNTRHVEEKETKISAKLTAPRNEKADLIIMGSTGSRRISDKGLGSVSNAVSERATISCQ